MHAPPAAARPADDRAPTPAWLAALAPPRASAPAATSMSAPVPASPPASAPAPAAASASAPAVPAAPAAPAFPPGSPPDAEVAAGFDAEAPRAALRLYGALLGSSTLREAAHRLAAQFAGGHGCSRVAVALHDGRRTRLAAVSNLDAGGAGAQAELPALLLGAIDEALEQGLPVVEPAPDTAADLVRLNHRALLRSHGGAVATLPCGRDGAPQVALCLERHAGPAFEPAEVERLSALLALAAPLLLLLQRAEEPWHRRGRRWLRERAQALRQPERRVERRLLAAAALALLGLALLPLPHEVGGRARVEGAQQRVLVAPTDGFVKVAHARPGDRVAAGAPLVDLMEQDLQLEAERWGNQLAQHETAYAAAMARADRTQAAVALARAGEAQSQLALVGEQLGRSRITAPFDGVVIEGDLSQSVGAPVRQGDPLLTLALSGRYRVVVEVDETDIERVRRDQAGTLSLSSLAWHGQPLVVERISPLARAVDGRNVFDVEARLADAAGAADGAATLRPGLLGRAGFVVGRQPLLWTWAGAAADRLRLAWWRWLG